MEIGPHQLPQDEGPGLHQDRQRQRHRLGAAQVRSPSVDRDVAPRQHHRDRPLALPRLVKLHHLANFIHKLR